MKIAIYPGSFDPMHEGHVKIIEKASKMFDKLFVVVSNNPEKKNQTVINDREAAVKKLLNIENVEVVSNSKLTTAEFAKSLNATVLVRSARNDKDFDYELKLAAANKHLNDELETVMIIPDYSDIDFSSTLKRQGVK